jgi:hypothetical protein
LAIFTAFAVALGPAVACATAVAMLGWCMHIVVVVVVVWLPRLELIVGTMIVQRAFAPFMISMDQTFIIRSNTWFLIVIVAIIRCL